MFEDNYESFTGHSTGQTNWYSSHSSFPYQHDCVLILGKKSWFNSIVAAYTGWSDKRNDGKRAVTFADGEIMKEEDIRTCADILNRSSVSFTWQQGDVLLIDNRQVLHARKSFEPPRRILAALFQ